MSYPIGSALFSSSENFLTDLSIEDESMIAGGNGKCGSKSKSKNKCKQSKSKSKKWNCYIPCHPVCR